MNPFAMHEPAARAVEIDAPGARLHGDLVVPSHASGMVLFSHGSGSGRMSPRNRAVARTLEAAGFATLLLDLLSESEDEREQRGGTLRFDVERLAARLVAAIDWLSTEPSTRQLRLGLFGASTGAASALIAATVRPDGIGAVVSRGGRPDLAGTALRLVRCPTLLIVGGADATVLELNRQAFAHLRCVKELTVIPRATHLFEEPGALEEVARAARDWFVERLAANVPASRRDSESP